MDAKQVLKLMILADIEDGIDRTKSELKSGKIDTKTLAKNQLLILKTLEKLVQSDNFTDFQIK